MVTNKLLIPSVRVNELERLKAFRRYFREIELDVFGLVKKDPGQLGIMKALVADAGVRVYSVHLRGFNMSDSEGKVHERIVEFSLKLHSLFQPRVLVIHPGHGGTDRLLTNADYIMSRIPSELVFAVENMTSDASGLYSPETVAALVSRTSHLPANFGICIDTTHPAFSDFGNPEQYTHLLIEYLDAAQSRLRHLQFSDRSGPFGDHPGKHIAIGTGIINWGKIDKHLAGIGYDGKAAIEARGTEDDIIKSACFYYGIEENDLRLNEVVTMPDLIDRKVTKKDIIERIEKTWGKPSPSLLSLLQIPEEAFVDQKQDYLYFFVPSPSYDKEHGDPFYALTGGNENIDWAHYLFGIRSEAGGRLHAILIDRKRKIAVRTKLADIYDGKGINWEDFESNIKTALAEAKKIKTASHVQITGNSSEIIDSSDERAWK